MNDFLCLYSNEKLQKGQAWYMFGNCYCDPNTNKSEKKLWDQTAEFGLLSHDNNVNQLKEVDASENISLIKRHFINSNF